MIATVTPASDNEYESLEAQLDDIVGLLSRINYEGIEIQEKGLDSILKILMGVYKGDIWTFTGEMMNGIPHGKGRVEWTDGDIFTGSVYNGMIQGKGEMKLANGDIIKTQRIDEKKEGFYEGTLSSTGEVQKGCKKGEEWHGPVYAICPQQNNKIQFCMCENGEVTGQYMWIDGEKTEMRFGQFVKGEVTGEKRIFTLARREISD